MVCFLLLWYWGHSSAIIKTFHIIEVKLSMAHIYNTISMNPKHVLETYQLYCRGIFLLYCTISIITSVFFVHRPQFAVVEFFKPRMDDFEK